MKKNENESVNKYVPSKQSTSTVRTQQSTADNDLASSLTIYDLYLSEAKDSVKFDIVATTVMSFARSTAIALFDANNIKLHTAGMMRYGWHVRSQNDARDKLYTTTYSDLPVCALDAICTQMYMIFWVGTIIVGVQKSEEYGSLLTLSLQNPNICAPRRQNLNILAEMDR